MRITIEITGAEGRPTTVELTDAGATAQISTGTAMPSANTTDSSTAPINGGPPPESLLLALGAQTGASSSRTGSGSDTATPKSKEDGGEPPAWLVSAVNASRPPAGYQ